MSRIGMNSAYCLQEARSKGILMPDGDAGPEAWNARDKVTTVLESTSLNEQESAEYCRRKGIYLHQLKQWRRACEAANDWDQQANIKLKSEQRGHRKGIKALEKGLPAQGVPGRDYHLLAAQLAPSWRTKHVVLTEVLTHKHGFDIPT